MDGVCGHTPSSRPVRTRWRPGQGPGKPRLQERMQPSCHSETPSSQHPALMQPSLSSPLSGRLGRPTGVQGAQWPLVPGGAGQLGPGLRPAQLLWRLHPHHRCDWLDPAGADLRSCPCRAGATSCTQGPGHPSGGEQVFWGSGALWKPAPWHHPREHKQGGAPAAGQCFPSAWHGHQAPGFSPCPVSPANSGELLSSEDVASRSQ